MFSGFNLRLDVKSCEEIFKKDFERYKEIGEKHLKPKINGFNSDLKELIHRNTINGSQLQEYCFPDIEADIFLSHSHKDRNLANALAGWINDKFNLRVFIDSNVWEYSDNLLEELNTQYSSRRIIDDGDGVLYDYKSGCKASEHVNMMLSAALHKMIDKMECVILLNTDSSVHVFGNNHFADTYSPWIYSEILCTQIVRKKPLLCYRNYNELIHSYESKNISHDVTNLVISYNLSLKHLSHICVDDLNKWLNNYKNPLLKGYYDEYPLDALYCLTHKKHVEITKKMCQLIDHDKIEEIKKIFLG